MKYTKHTPKEEITIADGFILLATGAMCLMALALVLPKIL